MQATSILDAITRAAAAPALAGIYVEAIKIGATYEYDHDLMMTIIWSMPDASAAIESVEHSLPGVAASVLSRPSDTTIELPRGMASQAEIEDAVLQVAWTTGAWCLYRGEHGPLAPGEDFRDLKHGIPFGRDGTRILGQRISTGDALPIDAYERAADNGWIVWSFGPQSFASARQRKLAQAKDRTLRADCTRAGKPGEYRGRWGYPSEPKTGYEHQYQLGKRHQRTLAVDDRIRTSSNTSEKGLDR